MDKPWSATTRTIVGLLLFVFSLVLIYISRSVLPMMIIAALIAFLVRPLIVHMIERWKFPRTAAVAIAYLLVALLIFGPGSIPKVASQLGKAVRAFRKITTDLSKDFAKALDAEDKAGKTTTKKEVTTTPKSESVGDIAKQAVKDKATKTLDKFLGDSEEEGG